MTIDDFCFEVIPSCEKAPFPTILNSGVDSNKLNLGWNVDTTQTSFIINYGPAGYDPVTNPTGGNTTTSAFNFVSVTGLNPLTEYCFWIKAVCTNGDTSAWAGPFCGETGCPSSTGTPYFQNFANYTNTDLPICWQEAQGVLGTNSTLAYGTSNWGPDGFGNVYAIGFFEDSANFDGTILTSLGRKDIFVWKMSMTPGSFTINNTYDIIYAADSMVFNPADTGIFTTQSRIIDGCDTAFVDSVVHQRLGVKINYNINNPGTATFTIDGVIQAMPYSQNYWAGETISIVATLQPDWAFVKWRTNNNAVLPNSNSITATFSPMTSDSCVLVTVELNAFIAGNDTICDNANPAKVNVYFRGGDPPFTFVYEINGVSQPSITTFSDPYVIKTKEEGVYTLLSFRDINSEGRTSGSAFVKVFQAPTADFEAQPDSMTIIYTTSQMIDKSLADTSIANWQWNFGDNTPLSNDTSPFHTYPEYIDIYQVSLIIEDKNGCTDTVFKQVWVTDDHWIYIPNSFTPDLDGINDVFCIQYNGIRLETFYFNVYDRFSDLVYSTSNISELECELSSNGWDGTHYLSKKELPLGTYIYEIYFQDFEGWKHQDMGNLSIIR